MYGNLQSLLMTFTIVLAFLPWEPAVCWDNGPAPAGDHHGCADTATSACLVRALLYKRTQPHQDCQAIKRSPK